MASVAIRSRLQRIPLNRTQGIFLSLLVLSICINYIDRGSLAVANEYLHVDPAFLLDDYGKGKINSAFFWTYALCQVPAGWLVDRFNVNRVLAAGFLIWSTAMLFTGLTAGFVTLFAVRLVLGIGESVAYPSYSKILANNFKEQQRGFANAAIDAGSKVGPALGIVVGSALMGIYGWRAFFYVMGGFSLLWLVPWMIWAPKDKVVLGELKGKVPSIGEICSKRAAWGTFLGLFCGNYVWYFMLTWLPSYFVKELKYTPGQMALQGSLPFWIVGASTLTCGFLSDRWISSGGSATLVRKTFCGTGLLLSTVMMLTVLVHDPFKSLVVLCLSAFAYGIYSSNLWAVTQTLAGPLAAGRWTGCQNFVGNLSGIAAAWLTGWIVQQTGQFYWAFVVTTGFLILGTICFTVVIPRVEPVSWRD